MRHFPQRHEPGVARLVRDLRFIIGAALLSWLALGLVVYAGASLVQFWAQP